MNNTLVLIFVVCIIGYYVIKLLIRTFIPKIKGATGEFKIASKLRWLNSKMYKVINNVIIPNRSGSSQIDHIVISKYGIFVIETKHYDGWIFGHERSEEWTQTFFKKKFKFRNPIQQNWGHINSLKSFLSEYNLVPFFPIVVFSGNAKLKKITSQVPVITSNKLIRYIKKTSKSEYLNQEEVELIFQKLISLKNNNNVSLRSHVKIVRSNKRKNKNSKNCPRCGSRLILKDGKYGKFYGCSSFPNCNFTKNV